MDFFDTVLCFRQSKGRGCKDLVICAYQKFLKDNLFKLYFFTQSTIIIKLIAHLNNNLIVDLYSVPVWYGLFDRPVTVLLDSIHIHSSDTLVTHTRIPPTGECHQSQTNKTSQTQG